MDARIDPLTALRLRPGDAHVLRNAGATVTDDVLRSLAVSQHKMGTTAILVVAHTDCGMSKVDDEQIADAVHAGTGTRPTQPFHTFDDLDAHVRAQVQQLHGSALLREGTEIRGAVLDVHTLELHHVHAETVGTLSGHSRPAGRSLP